MKKRVFEKINIFDQTVITGLVTALVLAIFYGMNELAMSIASGLLGYIGGSKLPLHKEKEDKK